MIWDREGKEREWKAGIGGLLLRDGKGKMRETKGERKGRGGRSKGQKESALPIKIMSAPCFCMTSSLLISAITYLVTYLPK